MILIFSRSKYEISTDEVIEWLQYYNANWLRINGNDLETKTIFTSLNEDKLIINDVEIELNKITNIWYRRWYEDDHFDHIDYKRLISKDAFKQIRNDYLVEEMEHLKEFIFYKLESHFWLGNPFLTKLNKLKVLDIAKKCGLTIPNTYIISKKENLLDILKKEGSLITKSISDNPNIELHNHDYTFYTEKVTYNDIKDYEDVFLPTLFQQEIEKQYEIRAFYLDGTFYSMAIFSQNNSKTKVDFRNYDSQIPNRMIPFNLPSKIEVKIVNLMKKLGLNTGSIDLLFSSEGNEYYFLEINPIGQFGMVSMSCNFYLEKQIALYLMKENN